MSLPDVLPIASYTGNASTSTAYPFPFKVLAASHVKLYIDGVLSNDAITVTGVGDEAGVDVTTSVAYTSEQQVTLRREVPFSQETDLVEGGRLREESLENALDYGVMQAQQLKEELGRAVKFPPGSSGSTLPSSTNSTIGQDANGDLVSRTAQEELDHLGVGTAATEAAASAAAAAISETNAGASETVAVASAAAAEASNVSASAAVLDFASKSYPVVRIGKKASEPNITSDVTISFPGGGSLTLKASARPYTEVNAINAQNVDVAYLIPDIINIINGDVTDASTGQDYGLSTGSTNVDNFTPITDWSAELATDGGSLVTGLADLTYLGSSPATLTVPLPLEVKAGATLDPPSDLPFVIHSGPQTLTGSQKTQARDNIGVDPTQRVKANLFLPNYDYEQSTIHTDVLRFESDKFGWRYWMIHSPYLGETDPYPLEYPSVCVSQDGENWQLPEGGASILTTLQPTSFGPSNLTYQHAADPCLVELANGNLRAYWLQINDSSPRRHGLIAAETSDGINWTLLGSEGDGWLFGVESHDLTSPSVIREDDDTFTLFTSKTDSGATGYAYRTSADGLTWSAETVCTMPSGYTGWHNAVRLFDGVYYCLSASKPEIVDRDGVPTQRTSGELRAYQSTDKDTWTAVSGGVANQSFHDDYANWNKDLAGGGIYRGCPVINHDGSWDVWFSTIRSNGIGNGDVSGDFVASTTKFRASRVSLARNVDVAGRKRFLFEAAPDHDVILSQHLTPVIEVDRQLTESWNPLPETRGWKWEYGTANSTGLASGASERIHLDDKERIIKLTNKGEGSMQGEGMIFGVIGAGAVAKHVIAGDVTVATLSSTGNSGWIGNESWLIITSITAGSTTVDQTLEEGVALVGKTSGASAVIHDVAQDGRVLYPKNPTGTAQFQVGEQLEVDGVTLTDNGVAVTVSSFVSAPTANGVNVIFHHYRNGVGGYAEIWNASTQSFHGGVRYQSFR